MRKVDAYYGDVYAGQLSELDKSGYEFVYDDAFLADNSMPAVSVNMPKSHKVYYSDHILINTRIHIQSGSDLGLTEGLATDIEKSDTYERTGHPCRLDFERFAERIGLPKRRSDKVLDMFMNIPLETYSLINNSFLNDKMKRSYRRIIEERKGRFVRMSD